MPQKIWHQLQCLNCKRKQTEASGYFREEPNMREHYLQSIFNPDFTSSSTNLSAVWILMTPPNHRLPLQAYVPISTISGRATPIFTQGVGLRTVRITVTAVQFTVYTGQFSNFDGTVRDYGTGIRPYLRVNYLSLKISLPKPLVCAQVFSKCKFCAEKLW